MEANVKMWDLVDVEWPTLQTQLWKMISTPWSYFVPNFSFILQVSFLLLSDGLFYDGRNRYSSKCYHHQGFTKESLIRAFWKVTPDRAKIKVGVRGSYLARSRFMQFLKMLIPGSFDPSTQNSKNGAFLIRYWPLCKKQRVWGPNPLFFT